MKKFYTLCVTAFLCLNLILQADAQPSHLPSSIDANWFSNARAYIDDMQYAFRFSESGKVMAINSNNKTIFEIVAAGYQQTWTTAGKTKHQASFQLLSVNGLAWNAKAENTNCELSDREVVYTSGNAAVQYLNSKEGLRQNFIISNADNAGNVPLSIKLEVNSPLSLKMKDGADGVSLADNNGKALLHYDGLYVYDAMGTELEASMAVSGNIITITVDDKQAVYPVTVDPLTHLPSWTDNGNGLLFPLLNDLATPLLFGYSVSEAGDVNGDGFGDVIVGCPTYVDIVNISSGTFNVASVGAAFLYYGSGSGLSATPSEALQGTTQVGALFGYSVSNAGDVNGDGFADVVIGAPGDRINLNIGLITPVSTSVAVGKVYIYYGGPAGTFDGNVSSEPTVSAQLSLQASDFGLLATIPVNPLFGISVSSAGDVNGDGLDDIIAGSPGFLRLLPTPLQGGRVDLFYGSGAGISATPSRIITGSVLNLLFGFTVNTAGNVNGDAYDDIIVGAPGSLTLVGAGRAFVFNGSGSGITATNTAGANANLSSGLLSTLFGFSVANAGDVNGDGFGDVIVGEPAALEGLLAQFASVGAAHIFYGSGAGVTVGGSTTLSSPRRPSVLGLIEGNLLFGYSVAGVGDVNCDGFDDVAIGEPGGTSLSLGAGLLGIVSTNALSGRAYTYSGRAAKPINSPFYTIAESGSVSVANLIGLSVSSAGDINNDGRSDLLIGAPNGTLSLAGGIIPAVGSALSVITTNSIGAAYAYHGCLSQSTLPVTITNFIAEKKLQRVDLQWTIANEVNLSHYVVERSADGRVFSEIGIMLAGEAGGQTYKYPDSRPQPVNYYRLRMKDNDGTSKYSAVILVRFGTAAHPLMSLYPNPARDQFAVSVTGLPAGGYQLRVTGAAGNVTASRRVNLNNESNTYTINTSNLAAGVYLVSLYSEGGGLEASSRLLIK